MTFCSTLYIEFLVLNATVLPSPTTNGLVNSFLSIRDRPLTVFCQNGPSFFKSKKTCSFNFGKELKSFLLYLYIEFLVLNATVLPSPTTKGLVNSFHSIQDRPFVFISPCHHFLGLTPRLK
uniref:Uncharacterized protein n=1 Tax=Cacopsylla melanoneura TaxID=428564 RepID=A0A8D8PYX5_9HEMI